MSLRKSYVLFWMRIIMIISFLVWQDQFEQVARRFAIVNLSEAAKLSLPSPGRLEFPHTAPLIAWVALYWNNSNFWWKVKLFPWPYYHHYQHVALRMVYKLSLRSFSANHSGTSSIQLLFHLLFSFTC